MKSLCSDGKSSHICQCRQIIFLTDIMSMQNEYSYMFVVKEISIGYKIVKSQLIRHDQENIQKKI